MCTLSCLLTELQISGETMTNETSLCALQINNANDSRIITMDHHHYAVTWLTELHVNGNRPINDEVSNTWKEETAHQFQANDFTFWFLHFNLTGYSSVHGESPQLQIVHHSSVQYPYGNSGNLKTHMMTHTGERPFMCTVCGKGYIKACQLTAHMTTHEGTSHNLPYNFYLIFIFILNE